MNKTYQPICYLIMVGLGLFFLHKYWFSVFFFFFFFLGVCLLFKQTDANCDNVDMKLHVRTLSNVQLLTKKLWEFLRNTFKEGKSFDRIDMTEWIWTKNLKMTEKITPTNINLANMTEIVWQRRSWTVENDRNQKIKSKYA